MKLNPVLAVKSALPFLIATTLAPLCRADILVDLDATALPTGPLVTWSNAGTLGGSFTREVDTPLVTTISGVNGVTLDGSNDWFVGPTAPAAVTGNGSRTIFVWLYNPTDSTQETVFAWGRRGGPAGTNSSLNHGNHPTWGAVVHWDTPDMGWNGRNETNIWTCAAYTYDSASGTATVFTNGVVSNTEVVGPLATHTTDTGGRPLPFVVGCQNNTDGSRNNGQLPGSHTVARIQIHDRALSQSEIIDAYNASAAAFGRPAAFVITDFTVDQGGIYRGDSAALSWETVGATGISISPAVTVAPGATTATVTPDATTTYTLTATDGFSALTRQVTVLVDPGTPVAKDISLITGTDVPATVTLVAPDPNQTPAQLAWSIITPPEHGSLTGSAPSLTYTPVAGYHGSDSFTYQANDGFADSNLADVEIFINPPPTAPAAVISSAGSALFSNAINGSYVGNFQVIDANSGETHVFQLVAGTGDEQNGWFTLVGNQLVSQHDFSGATGSTVSVRVRATDSEGLSTEQAVTFQVKEAPATVVINEIHYNPDDNYNADFIELHNPTAAAISLAGWQFTRGISYTFPAGATIEPGGFLVLAQDTVEFTNIFGIAPFGQFSGGLSGDGEMVELKDDSGALMDVVEYAPEFPWPVSANGDGPSMELIHPDLDNDLAGSWRASGSTSGTSALTYITAASSGWNYRLGTSEASAPVDAWRAPGFSLDGSWSVGQAPIGFGTVDNLPLNTNLPGMQGKQTSLFVRKNFTIAAGEIPTQLDLRYTADDGIIIWINGQVVASRNVSGTSLAVNATANAYGSEGLWYDATLSNPAAYLVVGTNTVAVQLFNYRIDNLDLGFDVELIRPDGQSLKLPTPGVANSSFTALPPPQIRQLGHSPHQPHSSDPVTVTAKVSDPQGVGAVQLLYQTVAPGAYIPAYFPRPVNQVLANPDGLRTVNPAFENPANWTTLAMHDDGAGGDAMAGDSVFTAVIPAQTHRTLVRYRITASDIPGAAVRVPYADDTSLNFAYFVYNGVPDYVASAASVSAQGAGKVWSKALLTSVPVYHWIIRPQDMLTLQAYNGSEQFPNNETDNVLAARRSEEWEGALVYDGVVYDHINTRLRGGNSRYGDYEGRFTNGKRHYKFKFNRGHRFQAKDQFGKPYGQKMKSLAVNKMFGNKGGNGWGMPEEIGATLWSTFGVPAARTHWFHFRVIDGAAEAADQYNGDFWGIHQVVEEYEGTFLEDRGMTKGNLYKMSDWIWDAERQRRYQSSDMVRDGSEFNNIRDNLHGGQDAAWLQQHVNYDKWYRYSAVAEAIRHYDVFPYTDDIRHALKNLAWYFEPAGNDPTRGVCTFLPYDWDASFGPNWNNGWETANNGLYGWDMSTSDGLPYIDKPDMKIAHRNVLREFRDLIWQPDQIKGLMDDRAAVISELSRADQDRWRNAPISAGTANDDTLIYKVQDMKNFCFTGWTGGTGPTVGAGGRAAYLTQLADSPDLGQLPDQPTITYTGPTNHSLDSLSFSCTPYLDPQGVSTFGAMEWRVGQIEDPAAPAYDPSARFVLEYTPKWESGELTTYQSSITVGGGSLQAGLTYRARVRLKDNSGRWSHWSAPYQFTTTAPVGLPELQQNLMITEIMYNPAGPALLGGDVQDFEFIELQNISSTITLNLSGVSFTAGIEYDFGTGSITSLAPGAKIIVVKNRLAFESRYGTGLPVTGTIASGSISNGGEQLVLSYGAGAVIHDFTYDDKAPWPTSPDGDGPSLQLIAPFAAPDHALPENWQASASSIGSPGNPDSPFTVWMSWRDVADAGDDYFPGISATLAYALGADLVTNPTAALPVASMTAGAGLDSHLTISFRIRKAASDVTYIPETSPVLTGWLSGPAVIEDYGTPVDNGDGTETRQARVIAPVVGEPHRFVRLRTVVAPAP